MPLHWINSALRDAAAYVLPRGVYAQLQEARRQRPLRKRSSDELDLSRIELLRTADRDTLRDPGWLERQGLPDLGLNHEFLYEGRWPLLPAWLHERAGGLLAWQLPCQFGPYLAHLTRYPISSYLEIGVRHGGTFVITVEYLRRFREIEKGLAVDLSETPALAEYRKLNRATRFVRTSSRSRRFRRLMRKGAPWDLVLIDADHRPHAVRRDFETIKDHARIVAFHDIATESAPGSRQVWNEIRVDHADRYDFYEFTDQYDEVVRETGQTWLGLGVAVEKSFAAPTSGAG